MFRIQDENNVDGNNENISTLSSVYLSQGLSSVSHSASEELHKKSWGSMSRSDNLNWLNMIISHIECHAQYLNWGWSGPVNCCSGIGWASAGGEHCILHHLLLLLLIVAVVVVLLLLYFILLNLLNCSYLSHRKFYTFSHCFSSPSHLTEGQVALHGNSADGWGWSMTMRWQHSCFHLPAIYCIRIRAQVP